VKYELVGKGAKMRKAEIVIITIGLIAIFTLGALAVVEQKVQHSIADGHCTTQKVWTLVPLNENCIPMIERRDCNNTNESVDVTGCGRWFEDKE